MIDFTPFVLSFKLAFLTTLILFVVALPYAWWLSQSQGKYKPLLEALTALPIVLPPSVLGFYLLVVFAPNSPVGHFIESLFGVKLVFTFTGLVVASCFYSLPFMVQPLKTALNHSTGTCLKPAILRERALGRHCVMWRFQTSNPL